MQNSKLKKEIECLDLKSQILQRIEEKGGWVNCHAHIDRAFTLTEENLKYSQELRTEKWKLNAELRKSSAIEDIYGRMARAIEVMIEQGAQAIGSFIDVDYDIRDKAIKAAEKVREQYKNQIKIKFMNQSSYGLFDNDSYDWFKVGAEFVDIIGGLLKADKGREEEHLDILLSTAKSMDKMLHIHVDEMSLIEEKETELLARKTIEHGMQGRVVAIHGLSINMHSKEYREYVYDLCKEAGIMFISCPISWLNTRRSEEMSPTHNPLTPVDELVPKGFTIGIGVDNICDIWMPFNDGNMWNDLRVLMEAARYYDIEGLTDIATVNGLKILGLENDANQLNEKTIQNFSKEIPQLILSEPDVHVLFQAKIDSAGWVYNNNSVQ
jgi:cytosine/creatinine deaminase